MKDAVFIKVPDVAWVRIGSRLIELRKGETLQVREGGMTYFFAPPEQSRAGPTVDPR
jgi:hypothetical protein